MFTDIFPYMESPPEPMNIDPPLPVEMELRLIVFDVTDVETVEEVPPEKPDADTLHDLMIKGLVLDLQLFVELKIEKKDLITTNG